MFFSFIHNLQIMKYYFNPITKQLSTKHHSDATEISKLVFDVLLQHLLHN